MAPGKGFQLKFTSKKHQIVQSDDSGDSYKLILTLIRARDIPSQIAALNATTGELLQSIPQQEYSGTESAD